MSNRRPTLPLTSQAPYLHVYFLWFTYLLCSRCNFIATLKPMHIYNLQVYNVLWFIHLLCFRNNVITTLKKTQCIFIYTYTLWFVYLLFSRRGFVAALCFLPFLLLPLTLTLLVAVQEVDEDEVGEVFMPRAVPVHHQLSQELALSQLHRLLHMATLIIIILGMEETRPCSKRNETGIC